MDSKRQCLYCQEWKKNAEEALHPASVMASPSDSTDSFNAEHAARHQPTGVHRLQSSYQHGALYLQVLENGIVANIKIKRVLIKICIKFRSGNPGPVSPRGNNQLSSRRGSCLDGGQILHVATVPLPPPLSSCLALQALESVASQLIKG